MIRMLAALAALLTLALPLAYGTPAFADLKAVQTAICDAYTNTIVKADGPIATCTFADCVFPCTDFIVGMDRAGWHVIHDMRIGAAWWQGVGGTVCPVGDACYVLIFLKN